MLKLAILLTIVVFGSAQDEVVQTTETPEITLDDFTVTNLDLSNRNLTSLTDMEFSKYTQLEHLDLSNNNLKFIHEDTFDKNLNLKTLNLSGNKHLKLPKFSLFLLNSVLQTLNISNCNLKEIYENTFDGLINMTTVDLSHNPIKAQGINIFSLGAATNLRKMIAPHLDNETVHNICNEVDILIEMRYDNTEFSVTCEDVRDGNWVPPIKESEPEPEATSEPESEVEVKEVDPNDLSNTTDPVQEIPSTPLPTINFGHDGLDPELETNATNKETDPLIAADTSNQTANEVPPATAGEEATQGNETKEGPNPFQRAVVTNEPEATNISAKSGNELVKTGQSTQSNTGTNVLIFLVVAVVVCGIGAFVYKYYKSRQVEEPELPDKELKEITVHKQIKADDTIEEEPLMNQRSNSVEIKEIDESNQQNGNTKNTSYIPITSVEKPT